MSDPLLDPVLVGTNPIYNGITTCKPTPVMINGITGNVNSSTSDLNPNCDSTGQSERMLTSSATFRNSSDQAVVVFLITNDASCVLNQTTNGIPNGLTQPGQTLTIPLLPDNQHFYIIADTNNTPVGSFYFRSSPSPSLDTGYVLYNPLYIFPGVSDAGKLQFPSNVRCWVNTSIYPDMLTKGFLLTDGSNIQFHNFNDVQITSAPSLAPTKENIYQTSSNCTISTILL